jgi:tRNA (guanine10-N2)-dimethyltransferase
VFALELGGEDDDFAVLEAASAAEDLRILAPGLALASSVDRSRIRTLAYTQRASALIAQGSGGLREAKRALARSEIDRSGTVAVRARDVRGTAGVDTQAIEESLGATLRETDLRIDLEDPTHELRACFAADSYVLGWLAVESVRDFGDRQPTDRPFFHPGAMDPLLARSVANIAIGPGDPEATTLLDPMCGTGGILGEGGLVGAAVLGVDAQVEMVRGTRRNLDALLSEDRYALVQGDATALPLIEPAVDVVVFDAPYGRQSKIAGESARTLLRGALAEARRLATRAVVVGDRVFGDVAAENGWTVETIAHRRVHRSLTRHVHVLTSPD